MTEPKPFQNKVILITGAARGIGRETARYLATRGATLSLCDLSSSTLAKVEEELREIDPLIKILSQEVDVSDPESVEKWITASKERFGRIDGCFNNAGVLHKALVSITETEFDDWNRVINVNLTGVFNCLKYELKVIEDGGSIVNMASAAGLYGAPNFSAYVASKHGVVGLTKSAAHEVGPRKIRVNAVCPSFADTDMFKELERQGLAVEQSSQLFRRLAEPAEVAALVAFLLGDESKFITKSTYQVDGGIYL